MNKDETPAIINFSFPLVIGIVLLYVVFKSVPQKK